MCVAGAQTSTQRARPTKTPATSKSTPPNPSPTPQTAKPTTKATRDAKTRADAQRTRRERQAAVAILLEVERDAASLEEPSERASMFATCADALWDADEREARVLFRRAWEMAVESDEADLKDEKENGRYGDLPERFTNERESVLALVAKRDTRMAEGWLRALGDWLERQESSARDASYEFSDSASRDAGPLNEFTRDGQRLALASSLLDAGEYASAARVVSPSTAGRVSGPLVEFLLNMRARAPEEADRVYMNLLAATRASADADANDVLLLSSYVLTPRLIAVVNDDGSIQFRALGSAGAQDSTANDEAVRTAFFDTAASILLRPAPPSGTTGAASSALYFAIGRMLPFFEREAQRYAPALRARMPALAAALDVTRRAPLDSNMETRSLAPQNPVDPLGDLLKDIDRTDPAFRDTMRSEAVWVALKRKLWERAKQLASEIKDAELRDAARYLIAVRQVASLSDAYADGEAEDFEKAAAFARQADLSPTVAPAMRAYGIAQAADLAARKGKRERAAALLDEAIAYAQQAENGTELRAAVSLLVATYAARINPTRQWETLVSAVAALNADEEFHGNAAQFWSDDSVKYYPRERETVVEIFAPFTIERLFEAASATNLARASAEARNIEDSFTRDYALVATARATLRKNSRTPNAR